MLFWQGKTEWHDQQLLSNTNRPASSLSLSPQTLNTGGSPSCSSLTRWMSETLCLQSKSHSSCVWRTSKTNPGTSGMNINTYLLLTQYACMQMPLRKECCSIDPTPPLSEAPKHSCFVVTALQWVWLHACSKVICHIKVSYLSYLGDDVYMDLGLFPHSVLRNMCTLLYCKHKKQPVTLCESELMFNMNDHEINNKCYTFHSNLIKALWFH